jgi:hypothetical protein
MNNNLGIAAIVLLFALFLLSWLVLPAWNYGAPFPLPIFRPPRDWT